MAEGDYEIIRQSSDQEEVETGYQASIDQLQNTENILTLVLIVGVIWFLMYTWAMWKCATCLKDKHTAIWTSLGKPTVLKNNVKLLKFAFGNQVRTLPKADRIPFFLLRWLSISGIVFALAVLVALFTLF